MIIQVELKKLDSGFEAKIPELKGVSFKNEKADVAVHMCKVFGVKAVMDEMLMGKISPMSLAFLVVTAPETPVAVDKVNLADLKIKE